MEPGCVLAALHASGTPRVGLGAPGLDGPTFSPAGASRAQPRNSAQPSRRAPPLPRESADPSSSPSAAIT